MKMIQLNEPTVFADLNKAEAKDADFARSELAVKSLKYKHFRSVMQVEEADQMHHLMMVLTGLSEDDLGELCPADAAIVSGMVFDSMKEYMQLGKNIVERMS